MNALDLAAMLNGREYREEITKSEARMAKDAGLVVVFGASDDLMEFRGAIDDEIGAYDGGTAYLTADGMLQNECELDDCPHFEKLKASATTIEALWSAEPDYSWTFKTDIPHSTFEIIETGEGPYCRGIVFALADVGKVADWRGRVIAEKADLDGRLEKLDAMIASPMFAGLGMTLEASNLLHEQATAMRRLSLILGKRLDLSEVEA
jgi:hypothetical protein